MAMKLAIESPHSRYQWVDALVTFAVMAWFTAALAGMVGEWNGGTSAPVTKTAVTDSNNLIIAAGD